MRLSLSCRAIVFVLGLFLLTAVEVSSGQQPAKDPPETPSGKPEKESKDRLLLPKGWSKLGLSDLQKKEVQRTRARYQEQIKRLQEQIDALKAEEKGELDKILTPGQKARLKEVIEGDKTKEPKPPVEKKEKE
jgi:flagellar motility protein MotE (MotC chaperone)